MVSCSDPKLRELISRTLATGREHMLAKCRGDPELRMVEGERYRITQNPCTEAEWTIHTHASPGHPHFSLGDYAAMLAVGASTACVLDPYSRKLKCYWVPEKEMGELRSRLSRGECESEVAVELIKRVRSWECRV